MTEFGMAMNIGGLAFSVSLIPVLAYAMNYGFNKPRPEAPTTEMYEFSRSRFKWCFIRDIALMQCSLIGYFLSLDTGTMTVQAVALQLTIFASYCALVYTQDIHFTKKLQSLKSESEAQDGEQLLATEKSQFLAQDELVQHTNHSQEKVFHLVE